jgi:SHOCT-like domain
MGQERERILDLLASGKITAEEAGRLLDALETRSSQTVATETTPAVKPNGTPKYMYVKVLSAKGDNVNVKVPLSLVRAGLKLTSFIPQPAMEQINKSMGEQGLSIDLLNFKAEDLEELIEALREMEVNVDAVNGDNVRVYCA